MAVMLAVVVRRVVPYDYLAKAGLAMEAFEGVGGKKDDE